MQAALLVTCASARAHLSSGFAVERNIQRARAFWAISIGAGRDGVGRHKRVLSKSCPIRPRRTASPAVPAARSEGDPYS